MIRKNAAPFLTFGGILSISATLLRFNMPGFTQASGGGFSHLYAWATKVAPTFLKPLFFIFSSPYPTIYRQQKSKMCKSRNVYYSQPTGSYPRS